MLHSMASTLSNVLMDRCDIAANKRKIFIYGFELFLSTGIGIISILLLSTLSGNIFDGLLFLITFFSLRLFTGGFHASTYARCFFLSNGVFLLSRMVAHAMMQTSPAVSICVLLLSSILILVLSPVQNANHPISSYTYRKNRAIAHLLAVFEPYVILSLYAYHFDHHFLSICSASILAVALMMIVPKIIQTRRDQNENVF